MFLGAAANHLAGIKEVLGAPFWEHIPSKPNFSHAFANTLTPIKPPDLSRKGLGLLGAALWERRLFKSSFKK